ncbi:MAG: helix-turn-helix transcriptional regulator [candidate division Zixibacteria bacterium]
MKTENSKKKLSTEHLELEIDNLKKCIAGKDATIDELLLRINKQKKIILSRIYANVNKIVLPLLGFCEDHVSEIGKHYIKLIRNNLKNIESPFIYSLEEKQNRLTQRELEICHFIKSGFSSKEIASLLNISEHTIYTQRRNIRRKLELANKGIKLETYLLQLNSKDELSD